MKPAPIELTKEEIQWIKFIKGHYQEKYSLNAKNWIESCKARFADVMDWSADDFPKDFRQYMFQRLLDIYLKIEDDQSGSNVQIKELFKEAFGEGHRDYADSKERVIAELCGLIQCNTVILDNGTERYNLNVEPIPEFK